MTVSTENAARPIGSAGKDRPVRELVVAAFFGRVAHLLARALVPLRVPPPALVLANALTGAGAALALGQEAFVLAALLLQLKTILDNADGRLARISGRVTLLGRYLDTEADLVVNVVLFATLGYVIGELWLAVAAFCALTIALSVNFNLAELYAESRGEAARLPAASGTRFELVLARIYRAFYAPQDRLIRSISARRLERALRDEQDPDRRCAATLAYHDPLALALLANLGLSTQLVVLGICLVLGTPVVYLWLVLAILALLPFLQLRREWRARSALNSGSA
ncbi:MAG: CDP-alcohol phosphatidyltransferase family protein [Gaiellaceae bacterium]